MIQTPQVSLSFLYRNATYAGGGSIGTDAVHNPLFLLAAVHTKPSVTPTWAAGTQSISTFAVPHFLGVGWGFSFFLHCVNALRKLASSANMVLPSCVGGSPRSHNFLGVVVGLARIPLRCFQMCPPASQLTWETGLATLLRLCIILGVARHSTASTMLSPAKKRLIRTSQFAGW